MWAKEKEDNKCPCGNGVADLPLQNVQNDFLIQQS